jgi:glutaminase
LKLFIFFFIFLKGLNNWCLALICFSFGYLRFRIETSFGVYVKLCSLDLDVYEICSNYLHVLMRVSKFNKSCGKMYNNLVTIGVLKTEPKWDGSTYWTFTLPVWQFSYFGGLIAILSRFKGFRRLNHDPEVLPVQFLKYWTHLFI